MSKIYTKVGDQGQTSLVGGQKVKKADPRIESYGAIDELNSSLGVVRSALDEVIRQYSIDESASADKILQGFSRLNEDLEELQNRLFDFGSLLAATPEDRVKFGLASIEKEQIHFLEERIDAATLLLPPLRNFILPAGSEVSVRLHLARTIARRAERSIVSVETADYLPENAVPFINRVSDYLFVMARLTNLLLGFEEVIWKKKTTS